MILMEMKTFSFVRRKKTNKNTSTWRVGSADLSNIQFPSNDRLVALWREKVTDGGELVVIDDEGANYRGVEIPRGIKPPRRQPFLAALSEEVTAI